MPTGSCVGSRPLSAPPCWRITSEYVNQVGTIDNPVMNTSHCVCDHCSALTPNAAKSEYESESSFNFLDAVTVLTGSEWCAVGDVTLIAKPTQCN